MIDPFTRRTLLALLGTAPLSAASTAARVAARGELAAIDAKVGEAWFVDEAQRGGRWIWRTGDFTAGVIADPLQGLTIAHRARPASSGAWVREWDGVRGRAEWFGAKADRPDIDNRAAIQAALDLCPTVELGSGAYHIRGRLQILRNGTRLIGAGVTQTDQSTNIKSTQIVCSSAEATILQIGSDSDHQPNPLVEGVQLADFTVRRSVDPHIPEHGFTGAIGIAMRWCVNCHIDRVFSIDSARGWFFYGTIENYVKYCSALRGRQGSNRANDTFIGFHLDYNAPLSANGGNASLYFDHCRAFAGLGDGTRPTLAYSAGLRTDGGWVDLFINAFETGLIQYGIDGHGDRYDGGISYRTEDLIVTNCVLDPGETACLRLQAADTSSAVQIANCYMATSPQGTSVVLRDLGGSVTLSGNQIINGGPGSTGISAVNVNNLRAADNIHTRIRQPIRLENVTSFDLRDTIHGLDLGNAYPAITLLSCTRGKVDCIVNGPAGSYTTGVHLQGAANRLIEVACTNLQAGAFPAGAAKVIADTLPVRAAGPFGNDCLAQGILA